MSTIDSYTGRLKIFIIESKSKVLIQPKESNNKESLSGLRVSMLTFHTMLIDSESISLISIRRKKKKKASRRNSHQRPHLRVKISGNHRSNRFRRRFFPSKSVGLGKKRFPTVEVSRHFRKRFVARETRATLAALSKHLGCRRGRLFSLIRRSSSAVTIERLAERVERVSRPFSEKESIHEVPTCLRRLRKRRNWPRIFLLQG